MMPELPAGLEPRQIQNAQAMILLPHVQRMLRNGYRIGIDLDEDGELTVFLSDDGLPLFDENGRPVCPNAKWYSYDSVPGVVDHVPTSFDLPAFAGQWFRWSDIAACFWPGRGGRAEAVNAELAPVRSQGGVYCFAWSAVRPDIIGPKATVVRYVGETSNFRRRMGQFGHLAGF